MSQIDAIERSFSDSCTLEPYGINNYLVHTGYTYHDGDELHIVLRTGKEHPILTDEGHTLMWLSYDDFNMTPYRNEQYQKILSENNVIDDSGRITVTIDDEDNASVYLQSIVQALLQTADLRYLSRQNVSNTFIEDLIAEAGKLKVSDQCTYHDKIKISENEYCEPTVVINLDEPVLIFAVNTIDRAKETLINVMLLKEKHLKYRTIAVIDENTSISEKDKNRLINHVDRPILGLSDFTDVVDEYISAGTT